MNKEITSPIILGHLRLPVSNISEAIEFFTVLGGQMDVEREGFAVLELRDGTRLQVIQTDDPNSVGSPLQYDFKVDDIDSAWQNCDAKKLHPSEIQRRNPGHDSFVLNGPDGCEVKINAGYTAS
ncbi:MAG: VOC family protein [Pseudomonadota bacterium]|nr:VOC family protein [Pseudomonadota bacterium]